MKTHLFLFLIICAGLSLNAQDPAYNTIFANNINAGIHSSGNMFSSEDGSSAGFLTPNDSDDAIGTIFGAGIWMTALTEAGDLKLAHTTYTRLIQEYYTPGPHNAHAINYDFNKVWKVKGSEIRAHIADFSDGLINDSIAINLREWPASGNTLLGLPDDQLLAPFFDADADGNYNPRKGDYPIVDNDLNQVIPDEILYTIFNDNSPSFDTPLGVEVHTVLYGFNCPEITTIQNTLFARHIIINRSMDNLNNFKFGIWMDPDLGCYEDDLMGCDTLRNAFYVYNAGPFDGFSELFNCNGFINNYADQPPVQSVVTLNRKMDNFHYHIDCSTITPSPLCRPTQAIHYANAMNSKWNNGTPLSLSFTGYDPGNPHNTNYAYHDDPNDPNGWSMYALGIDWFPHQTLIASSGTPQLKPGQTMTIDYAYLFTQRDGLDHLEQVTAAFEDIDVIQEHYNLGFNNTCAGLNNKNISNSEEICLYPNPTPQNIQLKNATDFNHYQIFDELGRLVKTGHVQNGSSTINLKNMQGLFFLVLINADQRITRKIVVL